MFGKIFEKFEKASKEAIATIERNRQIFKQSSEDRESQLQDVEDIEALTKALNS